MNEEKYIQDRVGNRHPFRVPEGYFDSLADTVMYSLPERRPRAKRAWLRPWIYTAAATVCAFVVGATVWLWKPGVVQGGSSQLTAQQEQTEDVFDEAADYMMLDNHDIYACLADY